MTFPCISCSVYMSEKSPEVFFSDAPGGSEDVLFGDNTDNHVMYSPADVTHLLRSFFLPYCHQYTISL